MRYLKIDVKSMEQAIALLNDDEIGRLFDDMLTYAESGHVDLSHSENEQYVFPLVMNCCCEVHTTDNQGQRGSEHWNWKGGITPENQRERSTPEYAKWRAAVFARDGYTCQCCGQKGGTLHAHHISPWAKDKTRRFDVSNGITLCKKCHRAKHARS